MSMYKLSTQLIAQVMDQNRRIALVDDGIELRLRRSAMVSRV